MYYLIPLILLLLIGGILVLRTNKTKTQTISKSEEKPQITQTDCCGAHEICEFNNSLLTTEEIEYFNDEELDELRNVREDLLTDKQIDDLREVLYTMRTDEIKQWLISLNQRHIHLPTILQQEARQLMAEKQ